MWLLGLGRPGLRGNRRHSRLQLRRTCLKVWWTSAPFLSLQSELNLAPNPEETRVRKYFEEKRERSKENREINNAQKGSWQAKERLRKVKRENTTEASFSIFLKVERTYETSQMVNTFNFRIFGRPKNLLQIPDTSESQSLGGWN